MSTPNPYLEVELINEENQSLTTKKLFMSAALCYRLVALTESFGDTSETYLNPVLRECLILEAMRPRNNTNQDLTLDDFPMIPSEADKIVTWCREHVLDFFINATAKMGQDLENETGNLAKLMSSLSGLQDLAQKKQSAGDTTVDSVE